MIPITRPTLLLDEAKCKANIARMAEKARRLKVDFRPHFKTHQSHEIGRWFRQHGVERITVSSLLMAEYFANDGWKDITVAFPVNVLERELINRLAAQIKLNVLVESVVAVKQLAEKVDHSINVYIKIDSGYHRAGVDPYDKKLIDAILSEIEHSGDLNFAGFLTHAGHSYKARSHDEIKQVHSESLAIMREIRSAYAGRFPDRVISVGDTPCCSVMENFSGADEIRPGNFVFYDVTQSLIGSCSLEDVAVCMACPVVSNHPERNELIIYGGSIHFSKDSVIDNGVQIFGKVVRLTEYGWELPSTNMYVKSLSQEHGIVHATPAGQQAIKEGDVLGVLPVHSCLTADCMRGYTGLSGKKMNHFNYT
ncbi:alanine racemase [Oscillatoria amoena NRMC-F 0135]|nr:alanine racemase [Oscillatoria amoena NRMC-F 0135]